MAFINNESQRLSPYVLKLIAVFPKALRSVVFSLENNDQQLTLELVDQKDVLPVLSFLKNHTGTLFLSIAELTAVDWLGCLGTQNGGLIIRERFQLVYVLTSHYFNARIRLVTFLNDNDVAFSVCGIFKGANWLEREVYDMLGIFFVNHTDLRRILTDYGFDGYPLRKDFPVTGYTEVRYDDTEKCLVYEPLELSQELRSFDTLSP
jgi:NADH dehydrogenase (ubiquinone) Fe-S protein 3